MKYKGIFLDIDNTLYSYDEAHRIALKETLRYMSEVMPLDLNSLQDLYDKAKETIHQELSGTASSHNKLLYFQRMCEIARVSSLITPLSCYRLYLDKFYNAMHVFENVYDFLALIKDRRVCLVSDQTLELQFEKINRLRLFEYAGYLVTSEEAGREKPEPFIFKLALKKTGLMPEDVCMVGDSLEHDIKGASSLGIKSFWFSLRRLPINDPSVTIFTCFKELIGCFNESD